MAITEFGQELSSASANAVYLLKTEDDIITGILSLENDVDINKHVSNVQEYFYTISDIVGFVGESDPNAKVYASTNYVVDGDSRKVAIERLDAQTKVNADAIASNLVLIGVNAADIQAILDSKGIANGICPLDANAKIPSTHLPDVLLEYKGVWDASTNTPTLSDGTGELNDWYRVNVAGLQDLGSGSISYEVGDKVVHNGTIWEKWDTVESVLSVFGRTGAIVAQAGDYTASQVGLGNVTNDSQLKRDGADFNTFIEKVAPVVDDIVLIEDSENSFAKKKVKLENMLGGGGEGGINYIVNSNAETDAADHTAYKDAVSEIPEDGTGGAPTLSVARSAVSPLVGNGSFVITKPASNVQGEGVNIANENFDEADKGKIHIISFEYDLSDANAVDGDFRVYFYDNTNSNLYRVNGEDIKAGKGTHYARVQVPIDCDNGSLLIHCAATHTDGYDFKYDRVSFGPQKLAYGTIVTDWKEYSPTMGGFTSPTVVAQYRRVGSNLEGVIKFDTGTPGASEAQIGLPSGLLIASFVGTGAHIVGKFGRGSSSANAGGFVLATSGDSFVNLTAASIYSNTAASGLTPVNGNVAYGNSEQGVITFSVPVQGWSSQSITSEDFGGRDIFVEASGNNGASVTANTTDINWTEVSDSSASWNGSQFVAPETITLRISGSVRSTTAINPAIECYVNGSLPSVRCVVGRPSASDSLILLNGTIRLNKGDILSIRSDSSFTLNNLNSHTLRLEKIADTQQILETETVAARYSSNNGQTVNNGSPLIYEDLDYDTHGAYNSSTGTYTVPVTGKYMTNATCRPSTSTSFSLSIAVNGVDKTATSSSALGINVNDIIDLVRGDEVQIRNITGASKTLQASSVNNTFSIARLR